MPSRHLPAELLDHIVDLLYDSDDTLKSCCLVSKLWIPRARKHLFADIKIFEAEDLESWKSTFPDPFNSPAHYTTVLFVKYPLAVTAVDAGEGGWISAFARVVQFEVDANDTDPGWSGACFVPFYGFSPAVKSLRLSFHTFPPSQTFNLIQSFPLLEDLSVTSFDRSIDRNRGFDERSIAAQPSIPPAFTGSLKLDLWAGTDFMASRLLSPPGGLRFRRLHLILNDQEDVLPVTALVEGWRFTLEYLKVVYDLYGVFVCYCVHADDLSTFVGIQPSELIDLSQATQLKDVEFVCEVDPQWVSPALQTVTPNHRNLQRVLITVSDVLYCLRLCHSTSPAHVTSAIGESIYRGWLELDRVLARLRESHSVCLEITYEVPSWMDGTRARGFMGSLFPELTVRGFVRPIERRSGLEVRDVDTGIPDAE